MKGNVKVQFSSQHKNSMELFLSIDEQVAAIHARNERIKAYNAALVKHPKYFCPKTFIYLDFFAAETMAIHKALWKNQAMMNCTNT